jgi:hypothetical protein
LFLFCSLIVSSTPVLANEAPSQINYYDCYDVIDSSADLSSPSGVLRIKVSNEVTYQLNGKNISTNDPNMRYRFRSSNHDGILDELLIEQKQTYSSILGTTTSFDPVKFCELRKPLTS